MSIEKKGKKSVLICKVKKISDANCQKEVVIAPIKLTPPSILPKVSSALAFVEFWNFPFFAYASYLKMPVIICFILTNIKQKNQIK